MASANESIPSVISPQVVLAVHSITQPSHCGEVR